MSAAQFFWVFVTHRPRTPTRAQQAPLPTEFSRQKCWSGSHPLLKRIFPTWGPNLGFLHCRQILNDLSQLWGIFFYASGELSASPELLQNLEARELWKSQGKDKGRENSEVGGKPRENHYSKRNSSRFFRQIWQEDTAKRKLSPLTY